MPVGSHEPESGPDDGPHGVETDHSLISASAYFRSDRFGDVDPSGVSREVQADAMFVCRSRKDLVEPPWIGPFAGQRTEETPPCGVPPDLHARPVYKFELAGLRLDAKLSVGIDLNASNFILGHVGRVLSFLG